MLGLLLDLVYIIIKFLVFLISKLLGVDLFVGSEMKLIGEGIVIFLMIEEVVKKVFYQYVLSKKGVVEVYINGEVQGFEEFV